MVKRKSGEGALTGIGHGGAVQRCEARHGIGNDQGSFSPLGVKLVATAPMAGNARVRGLSDRRRERAKRVEGRVRLNFKGHEALETGVHVKGVAWCDSIPIWAIV